MISVESPSRRQQLDPERPRDGAKLFVRRGNRQVKGKRRRGDPEVVVGDLAVVARPDPRIRAGDDDGTRDDRVDPETALPFADLRVRPAGPDSAPEDLPDGDERNERPATDECGSPLRVPAATGADPGRDPPGPRSLGETHRNEEVIPVVLADSFQHEGLRIRDRRRALIGGQVIE